MPSLFPGNGSPCLPMIPMFLGLTLLAKEENSSLMPFSFRSSSWAFLLLLPIGTAFAQQLKFSLMDKTIILERIKQSLPKNQQREEKIKEIFAGGAVAQP